MMYVYPDEEFRTYSENIRRRVGQHTLRSFLLEQRQNGPLEGIKLELIERLTESYDHARHDPTVSIISLSVLCQCRLLK